jgi:hypothetical protein
MDSDAIRRELSSLDKDITEIKRELVEARRDYVRAALERELEEKESQRANLSNQINVNIGNSNSFSGENVIIGASAGRDIKQIKQTGGDNALIIGGDVYIYPDKNSSVVLPRLIINIRCHTTLHKITEYRLEERKGLLFSKKVSVEHIIWDKEAEYNVIATIENTVTGHIESIEIFNGKLKLHTKYLPLAIDYRRGIKTKDVYTEEYHYDEEDINYIHFNIINILYEINERGYPLDDEIYKHKSILQKLGLDTYCLTAYREAYEIYRSDDSATEKIQRLNKNDGPHSMLLLNLDLR